MQELIDKSKVLKCLTPRIKVETPYGEGYNRALEDAAELVALMPTIEPEVRHGHWIFREEATPEYLPWDMWCSCCGEYHDSDDYNDRYCSKCGAKMDADGGTISKERFAEIGGADNG